MAILTSKRLLRPKGEGSSFTVGAAYFNQYDEPVTLLSVNYRIDCLTTNRTIKDWQSITPAEQMEIAITPQDNAIQRDRNTRELRQLTVVGNDDTGQQVVDAYPLQWWVMNTLPGRNVIP